MTRPAKAFFKCEGGVSSSELIALASAGFNSLPEQRRRKLVQFLNAKICDDGGFADRSGKSDLYYTYFGTLSLAASSQGMPESFVEYLLRASKLKLRDCVSLSILLQIISTHSDDTAISEQMQCLRDSQAPRLLGFLKKLKRPDGAYAGNPEDNIGSVYGLYLAGQAIASSDKRGRIKIPASSFIGEHLLPNGSCQNRKGDGFGVLTTSSAALILDFFDSQTWQSEISGFIVSAAAMEGGFVIAPSSPFPPDLLSTASALFSLAICGFQQIIENPERHSDFVLSLQNDDGGFTASRLDKLSDLEYSFYALLSLGAILTRVHFPK